MPSFSNKLSLSLLLGIFISKGDGLNCARSLAFFCIYFRCALRAAFSVAVAAAATVALGQTFAEGKGLGGTPPR